MRKIFTLISTVIILNQHTFAGGAKNSATDRDPASQANYLSNAPDIEDHQTLMTSAFANEFGLSENVMESFFTTVKGFFLPANLKTSSPFFDAGVELKNKKEIKNSEECVMSFEKRHFENDSEAINRDGLLKCLISFGRFGLDVRLYNAVFKLRHKITVREGFHQDLKDRINDQRSMALLSLLEDLIRENIFRAFNDVKIDKKNVELRVPVSTNWWDNINGKFIKDKKTFHEFDYQNGDIILGMNMSPVSYLIGHATQPRRRFSHAFMMEKDNNGKLWVLEAVPDEPNPHNKFHMSKGGVVRADMNHFKALSYLQVMVLRIKQGIPHREEIISESVKVANELVKADTPYNYQMSFERDEDGSFKYGMFCSLLVAHAYTEAYKRVSAKYGEKADQIVIENFIPGLGDSPNAKVADKLVQNFLNNYGIIEKSMPTPGDIESVEALDVVADFRNTPLLPLHWLNNIVGSLFMQRIKAGYTINPDVKIKGFKLTNLLTKVKAYQSWRGIILVPRDMSPDMIARYGNFVVDVFGPILNNSQESVLKDGDNYMMRFNPAMVAAKVSHEFANNEDLKKIFQVNPAWSERWFEVNAQEKIELDKKIQEKKDSKLKTLYNKVINKD